MAMTCGSCAYYTDGNEEICPKCKVKLRMTFLPHSTALAEQVVMPAPLAAGTPTYPLPGFRGSYDLFEIILRNRLVVGLIGIPLLLFGFWMSGITSDSGPRGKYNAIRMGMSADQVLDILYSDSRFRHDNRSVSSSGESQLVWSEGPIKITVYFRNGKVVNKRMTGYDDDYEELDSILNSKVR